MGAWGGGAGHAWVCMDSAWMPGFPRQGMREVGGQGGGGQGGADAWVLIPPIPPQPPPAKYGGRHTVTLIPGDGIGPELMLHVKEVFRWVPPSLPRPRTQAPGLSAGPRHPGRSPPPGTPACPWTSRRCGSAPRRPRTTCTTPSWPSAATASPSKVSAGPWGPPPPPPAARGHPDLCVRPLPREHRDQPQPPAQPQVP